MPSFSERYGHREVRTVIQHESLDDSARVALWNVVYFFVENMQADYRFAATSPDKDLAVFFWADHLKKPLDEFPSQGAVWLLLKGQILEGEWFNIFDVAERFASGLQIMNNKDTFIESFNHELEEHLVGYRFINGSITPIDSAEEASAISEALSAAASTPLAGVRHHLANAIEKLADRSSPDYPNSVKESISAVEAMLEILTKDGVLSKALRKLNLVGITVHPALLDAWIKMYGWTSDENGVRHSAAAPPTVDQATAKYMLVTCSGFVSWLIEEGRKANAI